MQHKYFSPVWVKRLQSLTIAAMPGMSVAVAHGRDPERSLPVTSAATHRRFVVHFSDGDLHLHAVQRSESADSPDNVYGFPLVYFL